MTRHRANRQTIMLLTDRGEIGHAIDIHQMRRLSQAHIEQRHEALATSEYLSLVRVGHELGQRLVAGRGIMIYKARRFHALAPPAIPSHRPQYGRRRPLLP